MAEDISPLAQYFIAVEQELMLESSNLPTAIFLCLTAHFIFNLNYHRKTCEFWFFIQEKVAGVQSKAAMRHNPSATAHCTGIRCVFDSLKEGSVWEWMTASMLPWTNCPNWVGVALVTKFVVYLSLFILACFCYACLLQWCSCLCIPWPTDYCTLLSLPLVFTRLLPWLYFVCLVLSCRCQCMLCCDLIRELCFSTTPVLH